MNWHLLQNSLVISGATTLLAVGLGCVAALALISLPALWRNTGLALAIVALALPPFLATNCWLDLLGQGGRWRGWLPLNIFSTGGTIWILALLLWPLTALLVLGRWSGLDHSHVEMEPGLTGRWFVRCLLWPAAWPSIQLAALLTAVLSFNNFAVPAILQTKVFPATLWVNFNTTFNYTEAVLLAWPLTLAALLPALWLGRDRVSWPRWDGRAPPAVFRRQLGRTLFCGSLAGLTLLLALSVGLPLSNLVLSARTWGEMPGAFAAGRDAIANTLFYALAAAGVCGVVSVICARWRVVVAGWWLFFLPGVLLGVGLIYLLNRPSLRLIYPGAGVVVIALALRYLALQWTCVRQAMASADADLTAAAAAEGARGWNRFRHVLWPQIAPGFLAGGYAIYLLALWDVETMVLIAPPGGETLALRIFNLLHYGHNNQVNALCLILLGLALLPLVVWQAARWIRLPVAQWSCLALALLTAGCARETDATSRLAGSRLFSSVEVIGSWGTAPGQFSKPRSLALDREDNLYVVDMTGRVQKFSPDGKFLLAWQMPQTDLGKAKGMERDADGNIIVIEPHYHRVNHFAPDGTLVRQWGAQGTNAGQLTIPRAAAVNSRGEIFVTEYTRIDRLQQFSPDGSRHLRAIGRGGMGEGEFNRPEGIGVDPLDRVFVADSCNHRVQVFAPDGGFLFAHGRAGSGPGEFSYPYDVRIDREGFEFVCEFGNSRVQVFDAEGKFVEILGGAGAAPGQFNNPWALALDSRGNLYVADSRNNRVQKFVRRRGAGYHTGAQSG